MFSAPYILEVIDRSKQFSQFFYICIWYVYDTEVNLQGMDRYRVICTNRDKFNDCCLTALSGKLSINVLIVKKKKTQREINVILCSLHRGVINNLSLWTTEILSNFEWLNCIVLHRNVLLNHCRSGVKVRKWELLKQFKRIENNLGNISMVIFSCFPIKEN